jgi:hypothetical protein
MAALAKELPDGSQDPNSRRGTMKTLKLLLGGAAAAVILLAFRDQTTGGWLAPGGRPAPRFPEDEEPVLGYDGMDRDMLIGWLRDSELDEETLFRVHEYEATHQRREPVLEAIAELMG